VFRNIMAAAPKVSPASAIESICILLEVKTGVVPPQLGGDGCPGVIRRPEHVIESGRKKKASVIVMTPITIRTMGMLEERIMLQWGTHGRRAVW
jgi:hypothetical protein